MVQCHFFNTFVNELKNCTEADIKVHMMANLLIVIFSLEPIQKLYIKIAQPKFSYKIFSRRE